MNNILKEREIKYSLRITNESLSPKYPKGTIFTFNRLSKIKRGEVGVICFLYRNQHTKKIKMGKVVGKLFQEADKIRIQFINSDYKDCFVPKKHVLYIHRAIEFKTIITKIFL